MSDKGMYWELRWDSGFVPEWCLSDDFCNKPVRVEQRWEEEGPVAMIMLCGHLVSHDGECDPIPPMSAVQG